MREHQNNKRDRATIGVDLDDRWHRFCVVGGSGQVVEEGSVANNRVALSELSGRYPEALVVMEAGCHSPWVSRHLEYARGPSFHSVVSDAVVPLVVADR